MRHQEDALWIWLFGLAFTLGFIVLAAQLVMQVVT
jgi:hypothetical protein